MGVGVRKNGHCSVQMVKVVAEERFRLTALMTTPTRTSAGRDLSAFEHRGGARPIPHRRLLAPSFGGCRVAARS